MTKMAAVDKALLYARTLRHLRPRQVAAQIRDRLPRTMPRIGDTPARRSVAGKWAEGIPKHTGFLGENRFRFLNVADDFDAAGGWSGSKHSYLWYYNLNYFEWLNAPGCEAPLEWIRKWIAECPPGCGRSWDPYPVSLRIIQWIRHALENREESDEAVDSSLAIQTRWLMGRRETKLLANHYLVNGIALTFAGAYFTGKEAETWLKCGTGIVHEQIPEQVLPDGGHFERSVMYHSLVAEDLLNFLNLSKAFPELIPERTLAAVHTSVRKMLDWLRSMTLPNDEFPLFNDAAYGIAANRKQLEAYAERLGMSINGSVSVKGSEIFRDSGFAVLRNRDATLFAEVGGPGPDYQPGHSHAGTLGFELYMKGLPIIVDTGTSTYEPGETRAAERSTAAHNTLSVDDCDSSEVWSAFRVARRAVGHVLEWDADTRFLKAEHNGYQVLRRAGKHTRQWSLAENSLSIDDAIFSRSRRMVALRMHFHPSAQVEQIRGTTWKIETHDFRSTLEGVRHMDYRIEDAVYCPEFGKKVPTKVLVGKFEGKGDLAFKHRFFW